MPISTKARNGFFSFRAFLIRHYFKFHLFALLYAVSGVPILITYFPSFPAFFHQLLAVIAIVVPVVLTSLFWRMAAQENPSGYVRALKVRFVAYIVFWILLFAFLLTLPILWLSILLADTTIIIYATASFAVIIQMLAGSSILEATLSGLELPAIIRRKVKKTVFRINARAYFVVIANGNNLENDISYFKEGMEWVNEYLKVKFKLGLREMQDYCNFFKLIALSRNEEEKNRIREALNDFANRLNDELDLTDTVMALRNIIGKPIFRFEDVMSELDFDVGVRKTLSKNRNVIAFVVSLIALSFSAYQIFAPFITNYLNSLSSSSLPEEALALIIAII